MSSSGSTLSSSDAASRAEQFKQRGNDAYTAKKFQESIMWYSRAILQTPKNAVLFGNRAAGWMGMKRFEEARYDCQTALKLDPQNEKIKKRLETAEKDLSQSSVPSSAFTRDHSLPVVSPNASTVSVHSNLPLGKNNGLFAKTAFEEGQVIFTAQAAAVVFDRDCVNGVRSSSDLLHEVLLSATLHPQKHRELQSLYPNRDEDLQKLPLISMEDTNPDEVDEVAAMMAASPNTHPALIIPPYRFFVAFTCGRFTPKQIHHLHHQVLYNAFAIGSKGLGGINFASGSSLFPTASILNHSCWPNAVGAIVEGVEGVMVVRALRPIQPQEEITVAYLTLLGPRASRRKLLWESFEFLCRCERCERPSNEFELVQALPPVLALPQVKLTPGNTADDSMEALICTNASCTGQAEPTRGQRGTMIRRTPLALVENKEHFLRLQSQLAQQQADSFEYVASEVDDQFVCTSCHARTTVEYSVQLLAELSKKLEEARVFFQSPSSVSSSSSASASSAAPMASRSLEHLTTALSKFQSLLQECEKHLKAPYHWFYPQLYSALGGIYFQKALALKQVLAAQQNLAVDPVLATRNAEEITKLMEQAQMQSNVSYAASKKVVYANAALLIPLLLTCASVSPPQTNQRLKLVTEAARIHEINAGGGFELFQKRFASELDRLNVTREAMLQAQQQLNAKQASKASVEEID